VSAVPEAAPYFLESLPSSLSVDLGSVTSFEYELPEIVDVNSDDYSVTVSGGEGLVTFDSSSN